MTLRDFGWSDFFAEAFESLDDPGLEPGRVLLASGNSYRVLTAGGERQASLAGRVRHRADSSADIPAVGDWVGLRVIDADSARIERVLPRRSKLSRRLPGKREDEQVVAANVDTVFIVMGLDGDFSVRRAERLLTMVLESGARPVLLLNKADLCPDAEARRDEVVGVAPGTTVLLVSCLQGDGVEEVRERVGAQETAVLVGSSGVGKSTLINQLLGRDAQKTKSVRDGDDRGRHTTSHRELFLLPHGGLLIDSPGIREVQLWSTQDSLAQAFDDIRALAGDCRYRDCGHDGEAGCAVLAAVAGGTLEADRLQSFHALQKELQYLELRQDESAQRVQKRKWRTIHKEMRRSSKHRRR